jgi:hypothetical protein
MIFDEETEEVGEVNEALEFIHVMFKVFLSVGIFPVLNRLRAEPEYFIDTIKLAERLEDIHFGNVPKLFLTGVIIRILNGDIDNVVFVLDFFEFHVGVDVADVFDGDSGGEKFFEFGDGDLRGENVDLVVAVPGERRFGLVGLREQF